MAAELAVGLAVGCSCPVCGSADHPAPASATSRVTREDEDGHESVTRAPRSSSRPAGVGGDSRDQAAGGPGPQRGPPRRPTGASAREADAAASAAARPPASAGARCARSCDSLDAAERELDDRVADTRTTLADRSAGLRHAMSRRDALQAELDDLLGDARGAHAWPTWSPSWPRRWPTLTRHARGTRRRSRRRGRTDRVAVAEAVAAAQQAGFHSPRPALAAHLADAARRSLEADARESPSRAGPRDRHPRRRPPSSRPSTARARPGALAEGVADAERLATAPTPATSRRRARAERLTALSGGAGRGARRPGRRSAATTRWRRPSRRWSRARAPTTPCGCGSSAYVLSERLRQVVAAANERLAR